MTGPFPAQLEKPVCVFCASSPGSSPLFATAATSVGSALAKANVPVVYGGGRRGIMGVVSQSALQAGGHVHGILPQALVARASEHTPTPSADPMAGGQTTAVSSEGVGHDLLKEDFGGRLTMEVVGSMHERKAKMAKLSTGGFIVLPGGYGTLEELMEMVTWNQIGMHMLPIVVLNIGNFFDHMRALLEQAVKAGFIKAENLDLLTIVDLPGGAAANEDESKVDQWGPTALDVLKAWVPPPGAGYGFKWKADTDPKIVAAARPPVDESDYPYLFSTTRFTSPASSPAVPVTHDLVALYDYHLARLCTAHAHFVARDGADVWGPWPGDGVLWAATKQALEARESHGPGDWRVRMLIFPGPRVEVQTFPAPEGTGPFNPLPSATPPARRRQLLLDPVALPAPSEQERSYRLYKTGHRALYDQAAARATDAGYAAAEVLLHTERDLLETNTANIAILMPTEGGEEWITPALTRETPMLYGTVRKFLLERGVVREGQLGVADFMNAMKEGRRVVGFNSLRGVWEAELVVAQ